MTDAELKYHNWLIGILQPGQTFSGDVKQTGKSQFGLSEESVEKVLAIVRPQMLGKVF